MPLVDALLNTKDITIKRRIAPGDGGDDRFRAVHTGLEAHLRSVLVFERSEGGVAVEGYETARFQFHPFQPDGTTLDIEAGDVIEYPDLLTGRPTQREVTLVDPVTVFGELDIIRVLSQKIT